MNAILEQLGLYPWTFWVLIGLMANFFVGRIVGAAIDDEDQSLYNWYSRCPLPYVGHFLIASMWPVLLYFWRWRAR